MFVALAIWAIAGWSLPYPREAVEPQPLPEGVADTGINILLDSSHQFNFFTHWNCQNALRSMGHRVTGNQAALYHALKPGTPMPVRKQSDHSWGTFRPFGKLPAPAFDAVFTYQHGNYQPYLRAEQRILRDFVRRGGGLVACGAAKGSLLAGVARQWGVIAAGERVEVRPLVDKLPPGLPTDGWPRKMPVARFGRGWQVLIGDGKGRGVLAIRRYGRGRVIWVTEERLLHERLKGRGPSKQFLSWFVETPAGGRKQKDDERRIPWEYGGLGGAFYPENEKKVGPLTVLYADNQLPRIIRLAEERFQEALDILQKMLPTPPNPGGAMYICPAAGAGGGWAENAITPKLAGTISMSEAGILSVLAHEPAHTMYGPEAHDGTLGCSPPGWVSEAHAGWFQRKVVRELGYGPRWPWFDRGLARRDPTLDGIDLANIKQGEMGLAWCKIWLIWSILHARYGEGWYPKWCAHVHRRCNDSS